MMMSADMPYWKADDKKKGREKPETKEEIKDFFNL
jgi:hypothetical protein